MTNRDKLAELFRAELAVPTSQSVETLQYADYKPWDSVAHMRLVAAIESAFDIMIETDDVIDMSSFAKAVSILEKCSVRADQPAG